MPFIQVTKSIALNENEIHERFITSSGPGGQNVNKVATAVQLRFDIRNSLSLPEVVRQRLIQLSGRRLTQEGVLVLTVHRHRTQERNRTEARNRLIQLIQQAVTQPKTRRATKPTHASKRRRIESKRVRSDIKRSRGRISQD